MQDLFISFGTGLSSNDSKSTKNINLKFLARTDNSGWNILINNQPTTSSLELSESDNEYYLTKDGVGLEYFQFEYGGVSHFPNLCQVAMAIDKYFVR